LGGAGIVPGMHHSITSAAEIASGSLFSKEWLETIYKKTPRGGRRTDGAEHCSR